MAKPGFKHKLTSILSATVVGYRCLMHHYEEATPSTLRAYHRVIKLFLNFFIVLILCFSISKVSLAHDNGANRDGKITGTPVHQYIAWEAGNAWKQIPIEMKKYLLLDKNLPESL